MAETLGIEKTCQKCKKRQASTKHREVYMKNYVGPCADSFCFASCDSSACRPVYLSICDACVKLVSRGP